MAASALPAPGLTHPPLRAPLLRLRSDEQLVELFREGSDEAFRVLHDRYRQRLFAYVRQMLSATSRQDAEDVMQDVFVRAYGALRADGREMNVRAWLYRVAHNRCIDHMRRPVPAAAEVFDVSRRPLHDPLEEAQRREDLTRLVADIARLPDQQRSALLMREIDGMSYQELSGALDVTVPAVKSLLVRARMGLVEAAEARDADCAEIRRDLAASYDRGVKASGHARRHMRTCSACTEYRTALRGVRRSFAALTPVGFGPLAVGAKLLGLGGGGAGAGAAASAGGGGAASAVAGTGALATATACKVAAVVCTAAITAGGAVEAKHLAQQPVPHHHVAHAAPAHVAAAAPIRVAAPPAVASREAGPQPVHQDSLVAVPPAKTDTPAPAHEQPSAATPEHAAADDTPAGAIDPEATPTPLPTPTTTPAADGTDGGVTADPGGETTVPTTTTDQASGGTVTAPPAPPADTAVATPTPTAAPTPAQSSGPAAR